MKKLRSCFMAIIASLFVLTHTEGMKREGCENDPANKAKRFCFDNNKHFFVPARINLKRPLPENEAFQSNCKRLHKDLKRKPVDNMQQPNPKRICSCYGVQALDLPTMDCYLGLENLHINDPEPAERTITLQFYKDDYAIINVPISLLMQCGTFSKKLADPTIDHLYVYDTDSETMMNIFMFLQAINEEFPNGGKENDPEDIAYILKNANQTTATWLKSHGLYYFMACWDATEKLDMPFLMNIFSLLPPPLDF